jgi:asparagine synthase (glutamine-hydrolysing)
MCGFVGVFDPEQVNEELLRRMVSTIHHRGPDDRGVWCDAGAGVGLAHARLSILDLSSAGHQPMRSVIGRYVIAFNGEIYNHLSLRAELEKSALTTDPSPASKREETLWRGHSDTETLLAGFEAWGIEATVKKSVGMFAFAVWDRLTRTLTLGRDRLGEKPLYYGWQGRTFLFGSELKALRVHPVFRAEIDRDALVAFMRYSYIPAPKSIYSGIHKLLPGTLLRVRAGERADSKPVPYWSLLDEARQGLQTVFLGSDSEALEGLEAKLSRAVALQQIADVPLGAFLSGGIDSSMIVALMQAQSSRPIHTFTIGFDDHQYNEAVHARAVARFLGTDHTELYVTPEEAREVILRLPMLYDEPFGDSSQIPTFLVSQLARRSVTVSLSGDAGDELFGGYNRYAWARKLLKYPAPLRRMLAGGLTALSPSQWDRIYSAMQPMLPSSLRVRLPGDKAHKLAQVLEVDSDAAIYQRLISTWPNPDELVVGGHDSADLSKAWGELDEFGAPENRMMALDALNYLPDDILCKVDRAAMGVSLETRVPFLDHRVVEFAWRLPMHMKMRNGQGKWILRQLLYKYVPKELIERPKMGFGVPIDVWLRGPLREWAEDLLSETRLKRENFFNPAPIRQKWAEHLSGQRNWQYHLWNVLMFQAWLERQV